MAGRVIGEVDMGGGIDDGRHETRTEGAGVVEQGRRADRDPADTPCESACTPIHSSGGSRDSATVSLR